MASLFEPISLGAIRAPNEIAKNPLAYGNGEIGREYPQQQVMRSNRRALCDSCPGACRAAANGGSRNARRAMKVVTTRMPSKSAPMAFSFSTASLGRSWSMMLGNENEQQCNWRRFDKLRYEFAHR